MVVGIAFWFGYINVVDAHSHCVGVIVKENKGVIAMDYETMKSQCHVRSAIRRRSKPGGKHWKNHTESLDSRISQNDKTAMDWEEYDPREHEEYSAFEEMPA